MTHEHPSRARQNSFLRDCDSNTLDREAKSDQEVRRLKAELHRIENSISWRITKPLRKLSRRYPRLSASAVDFVSRVCRLIINAPRYDRSLEGRQWSPPPSLELQVAAYRNRVKNSGVKIAIYTAIFGGYERLLLPDILNPDIDYICFTDTPHDTFGVWSLRKSPFYDEDPARIARYIKTHPHALLKDYDYAVWIDANIILRSDPIKYVSTLQDSGFSLGLVPHPHRNCVYDEAVACKVLQKDSRSIIDRQVAYYESNGLKRNSGLFETGFMVISLTDHHVKALFNTWWKEIENFSRRDQIGLAWALDKNKLSVLELLPKGVSVREDDDFKYFNHKDTRSAHTPKILEKFSRKDVPTGGKPFLSIKESRLPELFDVPIDIVICVHNALDDVKNCLDSVISDLRSAHRIILVNDYSDTETTVYLRHIADTEKQVSLIENKFNLGYTRSANIGLSSGTAGFRIILNSDTIVSKDWALKLLEVAMRDDRIGIVGPLSNAAGVQSIPHIKSAGGNNTVINTLPPGVSPQDIDIFLENLSEEHLIADASLIHGFCMGIKESVINKIGYFDAENFDKFYGEENDYCLRAASSGFRLVIAPNIFVFHKKSQSIAEEDRIIHMARAGQRLRDLYGLDRIREACRRGENHPILMQVRAETREFLGGARADG